MHIERQKLDLRRPARQVRRRPAAARLQGLHRRSARAATAFADPLPQSGAAGRAGFPEAAIKSLAGNNFKVDDAPDEQGKIGKRPACSRTRFPRRSTNEQAARYATNGALPPDLSLITRARAIDAGTPFYRVPDTMVRDIVSGYQEGGACRRFAARSSCCGDLVAWPTGLIRVTVLGCCCWCCVLLAAADWCRCWKPAPPTTESEQSPSARSASFASGRRSSY